MTKVYITGKNSFLTKNYINYYKQKKAQIFLYDRNSNLNEIQNINPDIIIHCAAEIYNEKAMFKSNIELTHQILEITNKIKYKRFVYIGSSSEYGTKKTKFKEDMLLEPNTIYSATKACGTLLCEAHSKVYNKPIFCFRPFSIYGPYEKEHKLIPTIYRNWKNQQTTNIVPNAVHDWTYVHDFILATTHIIENYDDVLFDIVNIGTGIQYTNLQVLKYFEEVLNTNLSYNIIDNIRNFDTNNTWCADVEKLSNTYNYKCKYTLKEGINAYTNFKQTQI